MGTAELTREKTTILGQIKVSNDPIRKQVGNSILECSPGPVTRKNYRILKQLIIPTISQAYAHEVKAILSLGHTGRWNDPYRDQTFGTQANWPSHGQLDTWGMPRVTWGRNGSRWVGRHVWNRQSCICRVCRRKSFLLLLWLLLSEVRKHVCV